MSMQEHLPGWKSICQVHISSCRHKQGQYFIAFLLKTWIAERHFVILLLTMHSVLIAFVFNAKSFVIFFLFFFFSSLFLDGLPKLFSQRFMISYQESVWPRSDSFLGHTKKSFRKNCSRSCYSWRVWHMTRFMHVNQHS